jgi:hypothetical protein
MSDVFLKYEIWQYENRKIGKYENRKIGK